MRLSLKIAWRFLTSNKGQTIFIAIGIAVGVSVQIFIGSLIQGLQASLVDKTVGNSSQITITGEEQYFTDYQDVLGVVNKREDIYALSISVDSQALYIDDEVKSLVFRGFNFIQAENIYEFKDRLVSGQMPKTGEVLIGVNFADEYEFKVGDEIKLENSTTNETFIISGIFDLGVAAVNNSWVITGYEDVQAFSGIDGISSIEIQVDDVFQADLISDEIKNELPSGYDITNWKEANAELLSGLNGQSVSSIMIQVFVIISVVLGIASVLAISVVQKSKQIGILKAMGINNRDSSFIFLFQGVLLGVFGGILGIILGIGLLFSFTTFALNPDGTPVVPILINYSFMGFSALIAITASTLAALIPATRSSRLDPMEVIKNG